MRVIVLLALLVAAPLAQGLPSQLATVDPLDGAVVSSDVVPRVEDPVAATAGSDDPLAPPRDLGAPAAEPDGAPARQTAPAGGHPLPDTPMGHLMAALPAIASAPDYIDAVAQYYREAGFGVPALQDVPPHQPNDFDENYTVQFPHVLGDINHDGTDDLLMDIWCTSYAPYCPSMYDQVQDPARVATLTGVNYCGDPHLLEARDGRTGKPLWNKSMDTPHPTWDPPVFGTSCSVQMVVGTVPLENARGILVYRIDSMGWAYERIDIQHRFMLLDPQAGEVLWEHREQGYYIVETYAPFLIGQGAAQARNFVVNPLLDVEPVGQPYLAPNGSQMALSLQGVGFDVLYSNSLFAPPGYVAGFQLVEDYQPVEWLARLDPVDGRQEWRVDTFQPRQDVSVLPTAYWQLPLAGSYPNVPFHSSWDDQVVTASNQLYWDYKPCCHDMDGDGRPEVVFTTLEWDRYPSSNPDGPYDHDLRLVVFAGDGSGLLYDFVIAEDQFDETDQVLPFGPFYSVAASVQPIGDADGDGMADYLVRFRYHNIDTHSVYSIRRGFDGQELWRVDNIREMDTTVIGDVDGDGGNDLLLVEWFQWEYSFTHTWSLANVTHVPVKVFHGATGDLLWRDESFTATNDIASMMQQARLSGLPDLDGDGVMEIPLDDPIYLPDGTLIHQLRMVSAVDDRTLLRTTTVGAFAYPVASPDLDGDGRQDLLLVNGDVLDLWMTVYGSQDGQAVWSRRMADMRISSYLQVVPYMQIVTLESPEGPLMLVNFQMSRIYGSTYAFYLSVVQRIVFTDDQGGLIWSKPRNYDNDQVASLAGASPASQLFEELLADPTIAELSSAWTPRLAPGGLGFLVAGLLGYLGIRRWGS